MKSKTDLERRLADLFDFGVRRAFVVRNPDGTYEGGTSKQLSSRKTTKKKARIFSRTNDVKNSRAWRRENVAPETVYIIDEDDRRLIEELLLGEPVP